MCMVAYELKRGNLMGLILEETLNGLNAFQRREASFFVGSPLLLQVWSLTFAQVLSLAGSLSFCMNCLVVFNPSRHLISSFIFVSLLLLFFSLMLSTPFFLPFFSPFLFFIYGYKKGFDYFILLLYPSSPTFLGILGTIDFKMSWVLKPMWSLWVA